MWLRANPYRHVAQLTIGGEKRPDIPFVLTYPLQASARTEVIYGQGAPGAVLGGTFPPLAYYPTGCDRFRLHFNASAAHNHINFVVSAWYQDDCPYYAQGGNNFAPIETAGGDRGSKPWMPRRPQRVPVGGLFDSETRDVATSGARREMARLSPRAPSVPPLCRPCDVRLAPRVANPTICRRRMAARGRADADRRGRYQRPHQMRP